MEQKPDKDSLTVIVETKSRARWLADLRPFTKIREQHSKRKIKSKNSSGMQKPAGAAANTLSDGLANNEISRAAAGWVGP